VQDFGKVLSFEMKLKWRCVVSALYQRAGMSGGECWTMTAMVRKKEEFWKSYLKGGLLGI
jgi:hypothetical protein